MIISLLDATVAFCLNKCLNEFEYCLKNVKQSLDNIKHRNVHTFISLRVCSRSTPWVYPESFTQIYSTAKVGLGENDA